MRLGDIIDAGGEREPSHRSWRRLLQGLLRAPSTRRRRGEEGGMEMEILGEEREGPSDFAVGIIYRIDITLRGGGEVG